MATNLDFVIMEAAQSGLLSNDEAVSMFTVTTEGANWEAHKEYHDRTRAAKALVKQYKKDVKAKNFKAAAADLDKAIVIMEDLDKSLKEWREASTFGSYITGLFIPILKDFIPFTGKDAIDRTKESMRLNSVGKGLNGGQINYGDKNFYINRLIQYSDELKNKIKFRKKELARYENNMAAAPAKKPLFAKESTEDVLFDLNETEAFFNEYSTLSYMDDDEYYSEGVKEILSKLAPKKENVDRAKKNVMNALKTAKSAVTGGTTDEGFLRQLNSSITELTRARLKMVNAYQESSGVIRYLTPSDDAFDKAKELVAQYKSAIDAYEKQINKFSEDIKPAARAVVSKGANYAYYSKLSSVCKEEVSANRGFYDTLKNVVSSREKFVVYNRNDDTIDNNFQKSMSKFKYRSDENEQLQMAESAVDDMKAIFDV